MKSENLKAETLKAIYLLNTGSPGESMDSVSAIGPFESEAAALDWIKADARALVLNMDEPVCNTAIDGWGDKFILVEKIKTVVPVPTVRVSIKLEVSQ